MSIATDRSTLARLQKDIADLRKKDAAEAKNEVDANAKANRAVQAAAKASSASTAQTKLREAERYQNQAASAAKKRADYAGQMARKMQELSRVEDRLSKAEAGERKKEADRLSKLTRDLQRQERSTKDALSGLALRLPSNAETQSVHTVEYDVFISHASEDKDSFVRAFAETLTARGLRVWYDEHSLKWGDSLLREIDNGLANSRFGVVVLSKHFFAKEWPQTELDGLMAREMSGDGRVLPIWHKISKDEVLAASPTLGNKLAMNTAVQTLDEIAGQLQKLCDE